MTIVDCIGQTGAAVRHEPQGPEIMVFHMQSGWMFICEGPTLDMACKMTTFPPGDDWKPFDHSDPLLNNLLEQVSRPIEQVGRLCDIIEEARPALVGLPGGAFVVRYDGEKLAGHIPLNNILFFNNGWSRRNGDRPFETVGVSLGQRDSTVSDAATSEILGISAGTAGAIQDPVRDALPGPSEAIGPVGEGQETGGSSGVQQAPGHGDEACGGAVNGGSHPHAKDCACGHEGPESSDNLG